MPLRKTELYASLWKSCEALRGAMDASQYKDYVLVLLFVKYVSDKAMDEPGGRIAVPEGARFADMVAAKGEKEIGKRLNEVIHALALANDLSGVIDVVDFNATDKLGKGKEMQDRLSSLIRIFEPLSFRGNRAEGDDLLGDAYEYLMRHFAIEAGKSKGQFYTPTEVSRLMAKVVGLSGAISSEQTIYDPTAGSGSLLLRAYEEARSATGHCLALYGQEMDSATCALARMNMILHGCARAEVRHDNTLSAPAFLGQDGSLQAFDFIVANPPFSMKTWSHGLDPAADVYGRFSMGIPPEKNGDYAFLLHLLASLKETGKGAMILPLGVLFRGGAEGAIRKEIVERGLIQGVIGLPPNLFYGTAIPACIVVLDKEQAARRTGIFMIDASKGFWKDGTKNRLRAQDIHRIVDTFSRGVDVPRYARFVSFAEIASQEHVLSLPRYIDSAEPADVQDIEAHLHGGIPEADLDALGAYWEAFPTLRGALFEQADRPGYARLRVAVGEVSETILGHAELRALQATLSAMFEQWKRGAMPWMMEIGASTRPKAVFEALSESILASFGGAKLISAYEVYQQLCDLWERCMHDDVHLIMQEGFRPTRELLPPSFLMEHCFREEKAALDALVMQQKAREREAEAEEQEDEAPLAADKALARQVRDAQRALRGRVEARYGELGEQDVKALVVQQKWLLPLWEAVEAERLRMVQALATRIVCLAERYETPLRLLVEEMDALSAKVEGHWMRMGVRGA